MVAKVKWGTVTMECPNCKSTIEFEMTDPQGHYESDCYSCNKSFEAQLEIEADSITEIE